MKWIGGNPLYAHCTSSALLNSCAFRIVVLETNHFRTSASIARQRRRLSHGHNANKYPGFKREAVMKNEKDTNVWAFEEQTVAIRHHAKKVYSLVFNTNHGFFILENCNQVNFCMVCITRNLKFPTHQQDLDWVCQALLSKPLFLVVFCWTNKAPLLRE